MFAFIRKNYFQGRKMWYICFTRNEVGAIYLFILVDEGGGEESPVFVYLLDLRKEHVRFILKQSFFIKTHKFIIKNI